VYKRADAMPRLEEMEIERENETGIESEKRDGNKKSKRREKETKKDERRKTVLQFTKSYFCETSSVIRGSRKPQGNVPSFHS